MSALYLSMSTATLSNVWKSFTDPETRAFQGADSEDFVILHCTVLTGQQGVTVRHTDRRMPLP